MGAGRKGLSNGIRCVSVNQEPPSLLLTQASLSIYSCTACQPSTIKLPVHFRPNRAECKSLSRKAAGCEGWVTIRRTVHFCLPAHYEIENARPLARTASSHLSKQPAFTVIRLMKLPAGGG